MVDGLGKPPNAPSHTASHTASTREAASSREVSRAVSEVASDSYLQKPKEAQPFARRSNEFYPSPASGESPPGAPAAITAPKGKPQQSAACVLL